MTTTADSAAITAQDRSQGRIEPVHAMNETVHPEAHKRSLPGQPPASGRTVAGLTDRQRRVIEVIRDSVQRRGYPPSMREIGQAVGLSSTSSVAHQLMALERKGFLRRDPHRPRAYEVPGPCCGLLTSRFLVAAETPFPSARYPCPARSPKTRPPRPAPPA
ncbi:LexA repressor [Streptomyces tendae]